MRQKNNAKNNKGGQVLKIQISLFLIFNYMNDNSIKLLEKATRNKLQNERFSEFMEQLASENVVLRCIECGTLMQLLSDATMEQLKVYKANFCGNRFCPMCTWRRAKKDGYMLSLCMEYIKKEFNYDFIFLTLTTPNVQSDSLNDEIKNYNKAFKRLMELAPVKKICNGYVRKLEVTYAKNEFITPELYEKKKNYYIKRGLNVGDKEPNFNTYNPHFHVVIAVNKSYLNNNSASKGYLSQQKWLELWQQSMRNTEITQVKVQQVQENNGKEIFEIAKYSAKDSEFLHSFDVFKVFYDALKGKQVLVFGGCFKDAVKKYKLGELEYLEKSELTVWYYLLTYKWEKQNYEEVDIRKLDIEEFNKFNKISIEDKPFDDEKLSKELIKEIQGKLK